MAKNERKRQKQLAAKKKKRQIKKSSTSGSLLSEERFNLKSFEQAEKYPIRDCLVPEGLFERGIGNIYVTRDLPNGDIAIGGFLVDTFCLGIKDAFLRGFNLFDYKDMIDNPSENYRSVEPAYARKLVEDAQDYADNLGFRPHKDYKKAKYMFGDIDSGTCTEVFEFGKDGKPNYISGPYDSPQKIEKIRKTLTKSCGEGGFNFTVLMGSRMMDFDDLEILESSE